MNTNFLVIGVMSGTSLDGLDIAYCSFKYEDGKWTSSILRAETIAYNDTWKYQLANAPNMSGLELSQLHIEYGRWIGNQINLFINKHQLKVDLIGSHGHTVFHQPEKSLTLQVGSGNAIWATCKIPVINDFRTIDVLLGGQGAPLVPVGDRHLYYDFEYCLNLGGFANISCKLENKLIAFDICPANIILNQYAELLGKPYDDKGACAQSGRIDEKLLKNLNELTFYKQRGPKSLGSEWVKQVVNPLIPSVANVNDILCTLSHHIAVQIANAISETTSLGNNRKRRILVTGGGAYNDFLINLLRNNLSSAFILKIPEPLVIEYKEAQIFAFLAVLRHLNKPGNLKSVTGASMEVPLGTIHDY